MFGVVGDRPAAASRRRTATTALRLARPPQFVLYATQIRLARAVMEFIGGLDPGAVRLAQTLVALIPGRPELRRQPRGRPLSGAQGEERRDAA